MDFINQLLEVYGLKKLGGMTDFQNIDILKLPLEYQLVMSCLFYPKTLISKEDINYINDFWSNRPQEWNSYLYLQQFMITEHTDKQKNVKYSYNVKISVAHFRDIPDNIVGISDASSGILRLKEVILPESIIKSRQIINISVNQCKNLLDSLYSTSNVVLSLDAKVSNVSSPIILIVDGGLINSNYKLPRGYRIGSYYIAKDRVLIHLGYDNLIYIAWKNRYLQELHLTPTELLKNFKYFFLDIVNMNSKEPLWSIVYNSTLGLINDNDYTVINQIPKVTDKSNILTI